MRWGQYIYKNTKNTNLYSTKKNIRGQHTIRGLVYVVRMDYGSGTDSHTSPAHKTTNSGLLCGHIEHSHLNHRERKHSLFDIMDEPFLISRFWLCTDKFYDQKWKQNQHVEFGWRNRMKRMKMNVPMISSLMHLCATTDWEKSSIIW